MSPKVMARTMLAGLIPWWILGIFVASTFWDRVPDALVLAFGYLWQTIYHVLAVELIEWRARRQAKSD